MINIDILELYAAINYQELEEKRMNNPKQVEEYYPEDPFHGLTDEEIVKIMGQTSDIQDVATVLEPTGDDCPHCWYEFGPSLTKEQLENLTIDDMAIEITQEQLDILMSYNYYPELPTGELLDAYRAKIYQESGPQKLTKVEDIFDVFNLSSEYERINRHEPDTDYHDEDEYRPEREV